MADHAHKFYLVLIASIFVQIPLYQSETSSNTLNLYHALLPLAVVVAATRIKESQFTLELLFFMVLLLTSGFAYAKFGMSIRVLLLPFAFGAYIAGRDWANISSPRQREQALCVTFAIVLAAIVIRNLVYFGDLGEIYSQSSSCDSVFFLSSGGRNLEATQLGLLAALLVPTRWFGLAIGIALLSSVFMLSRAGLITCAMAIAYWLISNRQGALRLAVMLIALGAVSGYLLLISSGDYEDSLTRRFDMSVEREFASEGQGRWAIWDSCRQRIAENPWGYGTGNGFALMNQDLGNCYRENNSHNVFLELSLDGGIHTCALFLAVLVLNVLRTRRVAMQYACFVLIYALMCMIELTGYDVIAWFFIGASSWLRLHPETQWSSNPASIPTTGLSHTIDLFGLDVRDEPDLVDKNFCLTGTSDASDVTDDSYFSLS